jgi:superfamily II DNA/RNA helicase
MKRKLNEDGITDANTAVHLERDFSTFNVFGLDSRLLQALAQEGFSTPTNVQAQAIPLALEGKDVLGIRTPLPEYELV